ncbi:MAG: sterol desaturase family protein [Gemmataceae bacterium]|nr:sterol desaturase family protein [Gemmataceae bacterium]
MNLVSHEAWLRFAIFAGALLAVGLWETLAPLRKPTVPRSVRWFSNLALAAIDTGIVRLLIPLGVVGAALFAEERGWGLFRQVDWPAWLVIVLAVVALDFVIWLQHVIFHAVPLLWRLHQVHHADLDFDASTGVRFHPLEMLISLGVKVVAVSALGVPAVAVVIFEILLSTTAMFNHANVRLPGWLDALLRLLVVTPDMHRVHHSVETRETNSNFGFNLPWWDFLFGTYRAQPDAGHEAMTIGLTAFRDPRVCWLHWMLLLPLWRRLGVQAEMAGGDPRLEPAASDASEKRCVLDASSKRR